LWTTIRALPVAASASAAIGEMGAQIGQDAGPVLQRYRNLFHFLAFELHDLLTSFSGANRRPG
jgi:hypothetical protein